MNNYTKFLADFTNMNKMIKDEDKTLILLSSLSDDKYETFVFTLINGKSSLSYNEVLTALVNHELGRKDKEASISTSVEILIARGQSSKGQKRSKRIKVQVW